MRRVINAILVAGIAVVLAGLTGSTLAAEEPSRGAPTAEVAPAEGEETWPAGPPVIPADEGSAPPGDDRSTPEVEAEPVDGEADPEEEQAEGDARDRGRRGKDDEARDERQPLASTKVEMEDFQ